MSSGGIPPFDQYGAGRSSSEYGSGVGHTLNLTEQASVVQAADQLRRSGESINAANDAWGSSSGNGRENTRSLDDLANEERLANQSIIRGYAGSSFPQGLSGPPGSGSSSRTPGGIHAGYFGSDFAGVNMEELGHRYGPEPSAAQPETRVPDLNSIRTRAQADAYWDQYGQLSSQQALEIHTNLLTEVEEGRLDSTSYMHLTQALQPRFAPQSREFIPDR